MKRCTRLTPQLMQRVCIWFGTKLGWDFAQTKVALSTCFGNAVLSDSRVYHWMEKFRNGRTQIIDLYRRPKARSGRSRVNIRRVENLVTHDRRITLPRLTAATGLSTTTVSRILRKDLQLRKRCAKYVPNLLTQPQLVQRVTVCDFWTRLRQGDP